MTGPTAPPNWYADPRGSGGQRYWDGVRWTEHYVPPAPPYGPPPYMPHWGPPPWKGAQIGRPAVGPGSLAQPGTRLGAFFLDALVLLPVYVVLFLVTFLIAAPHFGPIFPKDMQNGTQVNGPPPGFIWIYLTTVLLIVASGIVMVAYQTVAVAKFGRSFGMAWLHIRPVRPDLAPLGWGRSFARAAIYWVSTWFSWVGLLDPLWCLWDDKRQCLHDKVADSIMIVDLDSTR